MEPDTTEAIFDGLNQLERDRKGTLEVRSDRAHEITPPALDPTTKAQNYYPMSPAAKTPPPARSPLAFPEFETTGDPSCGAEAKRPCLDFLEEQYGVKKGVQVLDLWNKVEVLAEGDTVLLSVEAKGGEIVVITAWGVEAVAVSSYTNLRYHIDNEGKYSLRYASWEDGIQDRQPGGMHPDTWVDLKMSPVVLDRNGTFAIKMHNTTLAAVESWARIFGFVYTTR